MLSLGLDYVTRLFILFLFYFIFIYFIFYFILFYFYLFYFILFLFILFYFYLFFILFYFIFIYFILFHFIAQTPPCNVKVSSCIVIFAIYNFGQCLNLWSAKYSESEFYRKATYINEEFRENSHRIFIQYQSERTGRILAMYLVCTDHRTKCTVSYIHSPPHAPTSYSPRNISSIYP